jgi:hypothetical protein
MRLAASAVVFVVAVASVQARQSTDLAGVLSEMRSALGGEQALQSISLRTPDGNEGKLFIDATTHRPVGVSWMAVAPSTLTA